MSFETIKKTLGSSSLLTKHGLKKQIEAAVIVEEAQKALKVVVGNAVSERVKAVSVRNGVLLYQTASAAAAAAETRARSREILHYLEDKLGTDVVKEIKVRL